MSQTSTDSTFPSAVIAPPREIRPAQIPPAPVDDACLRRVEEMLDETELAIALVEDQDSTTAREPFQSPPADTDAQARSTAVGISVAIPVYNERATIAEIVRRVQALPLNLEILIVDDASTDGTRDVLQELECEPGVRVFYHERNQGKGAALRTAFAQAAGDIIIVQDADLEYDPADYPRLIAPIFAGETDVVYGSRYLGGNERDPSRLHRWGNQLLTAASNLLTGHKLTDMETCYKVFRRSALAGIDIRQKRFGFEPEITAKLARRHRRIVEVPIGYHSRGYQEGKKIGIRDAINAFWCIVRYAVAD